MNYFSMKLLQKKKKKNPGYTLSDLGQVFLSLSFFHCKTEKLDFFKVRKSLFVT